MSTYKQSEVNWPDEFAQIRPKLQDFSERINVLLHSILDSKAIAYHTIEHRTKSIDSFKEKISRSGKTYSAPLDEVTDLVGVRIILYYPADVDTVCSLIRDEFQVDEGISVDKRKQLASDQFGYVSVHLVSELSTCRSRLTEWKRFAGLRFELQVRTVLQHAWASISHALQYKHELDVPHQFKRRLVRLAGLLELADEEFQQLRIHREELSKEISYKINQRDLGMPIDVATLSEFLLKSSVVRLICSTATQVGLFVENLSPDPQLVLVCNLLRIDSIATLDRELIHASKSAKAIFSVLRKAMKGDVEGSADHWCAVLLVAKNRERFVGHDAVSLELWSQDYKDAVLRAARPRKKSSRSGGQLRIPADVSRHA